MSLKMAIVCDAPGCTRRIQTAFAWDKTTVFNEAVKAQGWRVALMTRQHFCPEHHDVAEADLVKP